MQSDDQHNESDGLKNQSEALTGESEELTSKSEGLTNEFEGRTIETHVTITAHQILAAKVLAMIEEAFAQIPNLVEPHELRAAFVISHRTVPPEFVATMRSIVEQEPELRAIDRFDPDKARDTQQFRDAFRPVYDRFAFLLRTLGFTMEWRHAEMAFAALQMYHIAKGLARDPGSANIEISLEPLRRDLHRHGRQKKGKRKKE